jgi:LDH2 family malate/lactate/ureidoglycolate dehydrogenase
MIDAPHFSDPVPVSAGALEAFMAALFTASGVSPAGARIVAADLVQADLEGLPSHGILQSEVYLERLKRGSVSPRDAAEIVLDRDAVMVLDAHHMLGHLSSRQAMALAVEKARRFGVAAVAVRNGFHFGSAGLYVQQATEADCIGMVFCNSRPVMPAPGGAQKLVGTNPIAFGIPTLDVPVIVDMATSAGTVGRLRVAKKTGKPIPEGWAVAANGEPTTDASVALDGMLLPMGGAKGFGLAFVADMMSGLLASGAWGDAIGGLHTDLDTPFGTSHFFVAFDIGHFRPIVEFLAEAGRATERVRNSTPAPGHDKVHYPGERRWNTRKASGGVVRIEPVLANGLLRRAGELGVDASPLLSPAL